jgi:uncharacterized membrane protein
MVTRLDHDGDPAAGWELRPTRSLTWDQAKRVIALVAVPSLGIGLAFLYFGAPFVIPFSGLEVLAVALAFYMVLRDGERREIIRFEGDDLVIERGMRELEARITFNRYWVRVELVAGRYRYHPSRLLIGAGGRQVELGRFLTEAERTALSRELVTALGKNR